MGRLLARCGSGLPVVALWARVCPTLPGGVRALVGSTVREVRS